MTKDESIQLVNYNKKDKTYTFDKKALQSVIEKNNVQDLPVSVISVAGVFRKGKSFLLNFFLHYLNAKDRENWLSEPSESLKGFEWRGGLERNTEGIHIWSKIFKLPTADGSQVAVILMDTQGTEDGESSSKTGSTIFALSALVSSVQVYNLSQQINENDFQALLWFSQYASFAQKESKHKAFQSLIFLVRDWQCPQQCRYGEEGGKEYLDKKLEIKNGQEPSLTKVRKDIRSTFEKLSCFLLPYPGKSVATNTNFNGIGNIKDIDDDFITHIRAFVPSVLSPNNLVVKKVPGLDNFVFTGNDFVVEFASYLKYYNNDELPDEVSKAEAAAEAYYAPLLEKLLNKYKTDLEEKMIQKHGKMIENWTSGVYEKAHRQLRTVAISKLKQAKRFNKDIVSSKVTTLSARMQQLFAACNEIRSEKYTSAAAKHYNSLSKRIVKEYNNKMIADFAKYEDKIEQYTPTAYKETHEKCKKMAMEKFDKETRFGEYDATECSEKLEQDIDDSFATNRKIEVVNRRLQNALKQKNQQNMKLQRNKELVELKRKKLSRIQKIGDQLVIAASTTATAGLAVSAIPFIGPIVGGSLAAVAGAAGLIGMVVRGKRR